MLARRDGLSAEALTEAFSGAGFLALSQLDHGPVQDLGEELLARARAERYPYGQWWALHLLGNLAVHQGCDAQAALQFQDALAIAPSVRNPENHAAQSLLELGTIAHRAGTLEPAADHLDTAVAYCRRSGNPSMLGKVLFFRGLVWRDEGDRGRAAACLNEALGLFLDQRDVAGVHAALVELARMLLDERWGEAAACLLALASMVPSHLAYRDLYDQTVKTAETTLTPSEFSVAWERGRSLAWEDVPAEMTRLTSTLAHPSPASLTVRDPRYGLTRRELEVLRLLAEGRSNRAIAQVLSLSERTIENYVLHVLTKLNLESRTAAAAFAVRNGLD
jgi:DNA-binding CsgD family transcriptional regulator